ncbi:MAG: hypothetical protein J5682_03460, partial [Prevotella sp.]|nr:hypothetical protein [Prevotella sp.]
MRKLLYIVLTFLLLASCAGQQRHDAAIGKAFALIENYPDSALTLLDTLSVDELSARQRADYGLLMTEALYKLYLPIESDSLVSSSLLYYQKYGDERMYATALHYKGVVVYDLGRREEAVYLLKEAEQVASGIDDELLRAKIYASLDMVNDYSGNYRLALHYAKLFLQSAIRTNDIRLISLAYHQVGGFYRKIGERDSASVALDSAMAYFDSISDESKSYLLANLASQYITQHDYEQARHLLDQALLYGENGNIYNMLGLLSMHEDDTVSAIRYLEKSISMNENVSKCNALRNLSRIYLHKGDYRRALFLTLQSDSVASVLQEERLSSKILGIQEKYDHSVKRVVLFKRILWLLFTLLTFVSIFMGIFFSYYLKIRMLQRHIKEKESSIQTDLVQIQQLRNIIVSLYDKGDEMERGSARLQSLLEEKEKDLDMSKLEVETLYARLEESQKRIGLCRNRSKRIEKEDALPVRTLREIGDKMSLDLAKGALLYQSLNERKELIPFKDDDEKCFVLYFMLTFSHDYIDLFSQYRSLTLRLRTFKILEFL